MIRQASDIARSFVMSGLLMLSACASPSEAPSTAPSPSTMDPEQASLNAIGCKVLRLIEPDGDPLDITGTWTHPLAVPWDVRQLGDCVFMVAFEQVGTPVSDVVFHWSCDGKLDADFSAYGRCVQMGRGGAFLSFEPMRLDILFSEAGEPEILLIPADCLRGETAPHCLENPHLTRSGPGLEPWPSPSS